MPRAERTKDGLCAACDRVAKGEEGGKTKCLRLSTCRGVRAPPTTAAQSASVGADGAAASAPSAPEKTKTLKSVPLTLNFLIS